MFKKDTGTNVKNLFPQKSLKIWRRFYQTQRKGFFFLEKLYKICQTDSQPIMGLSSWPVVLSQLLQGCADPWADPGILCHAVEMPFLVEEGTGGVKLHYPPSIQHHHPAELQRASCFNEVQHPAVCRGPPRALQLLLMFVCIPLPLVLLPRPGYSLLMSVITEFDLVVWYLLQSADASSGDRCIHLVGHQIELSLGGFIPEYSLMPSFIHGSSANSHPSANARG